MCMEVDADIMIQVSLILGRCNLLQLLIHARIKCGRF